MPGKTLEVRGTDPLRRGRGGSEIGRPSVFRVCSAGSSEAPGQLFFCSTDNKTSLYLGERGETGSRRVSFPSIGTVRAQKMSSRQTGKKLGACQREAPKPYGAPFQSTQHMRHAGKQLTLSENLTFPVFRPRLSIIP